MSDPRSVLQAKFADANRFGNFGPILLQMKVCGFRCHADTVVDIKSPITAFCGLNGTGKSTLLQLAAVAYKRPREEGPGYYIKDFLVVGTLDPSPFRNDARVEYKFWQEDRNLRPLTISRRSTSSNWSGYRRRIERPVQFAGVGLYLPRIETRDFIVRFASKLHVDSSEAVARHIQEWTSKIMDQRYDEMQRHTVSYSQRTKGVVSVLRGGNRYSEAHMGCGEGRIQYLVTTLEALPPKSVILIEEPETSLHPHAQHVFGNYLVDVVARLGHQVFLTTHSEALLAALPSLSTIYVHNAGDRINLIYGLTAVEAKSLMSKGHEKALNVLVEDTVGTIDKDGVFTAGQDKGTFSVTASTGALRCSTMIVVAEQGSLPMPPVRTPAIPASLKWSGEIPPQKWMNFYTKVLSKFVGSASLRLTLSIEVSSTEGVSPQRIEETKIALQELGLSDNINAQ